MKRGICLGLLLCLAAGCARNRYENVAPESKISAVKVEMTEKQVREIMGRPDDISRSERTLVKVLWYPLTLLILPAFYHPPYSDMTYYYAEEGRVIFRTGWAGDVNYRVIEVEGDPAEDGYQ